jgi:hypothetical protein
MSNQETGSRTQHQQHTTDPKMTPPPATATTATAATGATATPAPRDDGRDIVVNRADPGRPRLDRIRWSSVWGGIVIALALYLFLQLTLVTTGLVDIGEAGREAAFWSAGAALVAFFVGGLVAGASAVWRDVDDGLLHGIVMWALGIVLLLVLAGVSGGIALGAVDTTNAFDQITGPDPDVTVVADDAQDAAGWAIIGLTAALVAAAAGAVLGAKIWPGTRSIDDRDVDGRHRDDDARYGRRSDTGVRYGDGDGRGDPGYTA